jgi:N-acetylglucosamine malate deacetylase 1
VTVVVLAPHPDDESLGCGGAVAGHAAAGDHVTVVWLTSGEAGAGTDDPAEGRRVREAEARAAAAVLGVDGLVFLGLPDGALDAHESEAVDAVAVLVASLRPDVVYAPHADDGHADHQAAHRIARTALARGLPDAPGGVLRCYEVWTPLPWFDVVLPLGDAMAAKLAAVRCHASQLAHYRLDRAAEGLAAYRGGVGRWLRPRRGVRLPVSCRLQLGHVAHGGAAGRPASSGRRASTARNGAGRASTPAGPGSLEAASGIEPPYGALQAVPMGADSCSHVHFPRPIGVSTERMCTNVQPSGAVSVPDLSAMPTAHTPRSNATLPGRGGNRSARHLHSDRVRATLLDSLAPGAPAGSLAAGERCLVL